MNFLVPRIFYYLFSLPLKIIFKVFFSLKVEFKQDLKNIKGPLIIASSHASWIDPFLIAAVFPLSSKAVPVHYATWWKYYYFPFFTPLLFLFGSFPVRKGVGLKKSLRAGSQILKKGGVVGIFPSGKRMRKWDESLQPRAKRGAAYLAMENNIQILPVKIEGNIGMSFIRFLMRRYKITVKIGSPFYLSGQKFKHVEKLNKPADFIMEKIVNL